MVVRPPVGSPYTLRVTIEVWRGETYVVPPSGWPAPLKTLGPEYSFQEVSA